jgi:hypothetical protein
MEMLQDAQNLMKIDDMTDVVRSLGSVLSDLEDTWTMVRVWKTEELSQRAGRRLAERSGHGPNGAS